MKKIIAGLLGVVSVLSCFAGVGCNVLGGGGGGLTPEEEAKALVIEYYKAGYGGDWITNLAAEYKKRTGQEVVLLPRSGQAGLDAMATSLRSGTAETDIFFMSSPSFADVYRGQVIANGKKYDSWFADLTDLYESEITGENVKVKDKMFDYFEEYFKMDAHGKYYDDKYYFFPYVTGALGFVVNLDVWDTVANGQQFPRTTDELLEFCDTIKAQKAPFLYSLSDEYWTASLPLFMNQYEGNERMDKYYQGYGPTQDGRYETNMVAYTGYKRALEFFEDLLANENGYMHEDSTSLSFMQMQGAFLNGEALFMVNGDWLEREMITKYPDANIAMMKTPVLSAVADKCSFKNEANRDEILRNVIDYVDGKTTTKPTGCTDADIEIVREARSIEYVTGTGSTACVPSYSNQITAAKDFLRLMASDDGMVIFRNGTNGCEVPFNYTDASKANNANASVFRKSINDILSVSEARFINQKDKIFSLGGINVQLYNNQNGRFVKAFTSQENKVTAEQYFNSEVATVNGLLEGAKKQANIK
ncbi:MAG: extracellular solute-binding protein [Clostridia bacterium]|nr:extracellular solute-binding protein [Clostridia bacterium]